MNNEGMQKLRQSLARALMLRCPNCGQASVFESAIKTKPVCTSCGYLIEREQGYFVGAIYFNVIVTESLIIAAFVISTLILGGFNPKIEIILLVLAVVLPVLFFRHSRSLWVAFDYLISPPVPR